MISSESEDDHPGHSEREKRALDFIDYFIVPIIIFPAFVLITALPTFWGWLRRKR